MEALTTKASNAMFGLVCKTAFRHEYSVKMLRKNFELLSTMEGLILHHPKARHEPLDLDGVSAELVEATPDPKATIFYLHGGGYFMGSVRCYRRQAYNIAALCNARVVLVEYRLAPEHPHPAALEDSLKALSTLEKRFPRTKTIIAGDSAGGGLTLATLLALRDRGEKMPAGAICISPWADLVGTGASMKTNHGKDKWLTKKHIDTWAPWYYRKLDANLPAISPVFGNYKGLPPLLLMVGDQEVLLDDSVRVAARAREASVKTKLVIAPGMQHDWLLQMPWLKHSKQSLEELAAFVTSLC